MAVVVKNGIGVSTRSGALMMSAGVASYGEDGAAFKSPAPAPELDAAKWSKWGDNNLLPIEMADHITNCGVLSAALDAKPRIAVGKGPQPFLLTNITPDGKEELEWVSDTEIQDFLEANNTFDLSLDLSFDESAYGWNTGSFILNKKRDRINRIRRIDVVNGRLGKMNNKGVIEHVYKCYDWSKSTTGNQVAQITALKEDDELEDLMARNSGYEFAFINRRHRNGRTYYPFPLWWAAKAWVKVARSVPAFKNAMFTNQIQLKYIINISKKYFTETFAGWDEMEVNEQEKIVQDKYDEIEEWLTGEDKAYKTLIGGSFFDDIKGVEIPFIKVEVLDDKVKDGKLLPESSAANSEILFALMMNPALMGAGQPGGPYSNNAGGSNVRESYLVQLMIMEAERKKNLKPLIIAKNFNGWGKRLEVARDVYASAASGNTATITKKKMTPRLVFRYPSGLLTTLDTGKSTKSETV